MGDLSVADAEAEADMRDTTESTVFDRVRPTDGFVLVVELPPEWRERCPRWRSDEPCADASSFPEDLRLLCFAARLKNFLPNSRRASVLLLSLTAAGLRLGELGDGASDGVAADESRMILPRRKVEEVNGSKLESQSRLPVSSGVSQCFE